MQRAAQPSRKRQPQEGHGTDGLYDTDVPEWSGRQASILRRVAAGDPGEAPDWASIPAWANIIKETVDGQPLPVPHEAWTPIPVARP